MPANNKNLTIKRLRAKAFDTTLSSKARLDAMKKSLRRYPSKINIKETGKALKDLLDQERDPALRDKAIKFRDKIQAGDFSTAEPDDTREEIEIPESKTGLPKTVLESVEYRNRGVKNDRPQEHIYFPKDDPEFLQRYSDLFEKAGYSVEALPKGFFEDAFNDLPGPIGRCLNPAFCSGYVSWKESKGFGEHIPPRDSVWFLAFLNTEEAARWHELDTLLAPSEHPVGKELRRRMLESGELQEWEVAYASILFLQILLRIDEKYWMPGILADTLMKASQEYADLEREPLSSRGVWWTMDKLLPGSAYKPFDSLADKLIALESRAAVHLAYDRFMVAHGQTGNIETDSPKKRLAVYDGHIAQVAEAAENEEERILAFLGFYCKVNSFYCARCVLDKDFVFFAHREMFDTYVQKNPWLEIGEQDGNHDRLVMMPRGAFKTTGSICDTVSWLLNFPDIRVLQLTATLELAKMLLKELRQIFTPPDIENLTDPFQAIFLRDFRFEKQKCNGKYPQVTFLLTEIGKETELICPARTVRKLEPNILVGSILKVRTGTHIDVLRADDVVTESNASTGDQIEKIISKIQHISRLCDPGTSFRDFIGTSYAINDFYAVTRANPGAFQLLIKPAKWLKKDSWNNTAIERGTLKGDLKPTDWNVLFPVDKHGKAKLSSDFLLGVEQNESEIYPSQYMLDPRGMQFAPFTEALIESRIIPRDRMPQTCATYILADLADSVENYSDYTCLAVLQVDAENIGYITEIVRGKFLPSEIVYRIAELNHRVKPLRILIEKSKGAEKMEGDIRRQARDLGDVSIPLEFFKMELFKGAKISRISRLESKLSQRRFFFLDEISCREELIAEFRDFPRGKHDDIADVCSQSYRVLPDARPSPADPFAEELATRILRAKAFDELIFNSSPEDDIMVHHIEPMSETVMNDSPDDLWDPFSPGAFGK